MNSSDLGVYTHPNARRDPLYGSSLLSGKRVTMIGLGGGGEIALKLLQSGITQMNLIDFDILDEGNLIRHVCGKKYVGKNKAQAVRELLCEYASEDLKEIRAFDWDIFKNPQQFKDLVRDSDLVIIGTDNDASRFFINDVCVEAGKPALFVSMFTRGCGGEVFIYVPGKACFHCLARHQGRKDFLQEYHATLNKADCSSARDIRSMPGLGVDQSFLCSLAARKSLDLLLSGLEHSLPPIHKDANWIILSLFGIPGAVEECLSSLVYSFGIHNSCECGVSSTSHWTRFSL